MSTLVPCRQECNYVQARCSTVQCSAVQCSAALSYEAPACTRLLMWDGPQTFLLLNTELLQVQLKNCRPSLAVSFIRYCSAEICDPYVLLLSEWVNHHTSFVSRAISHCTRFVSFGGEMPRWQPQPAVPGGARAHFLTISRHQKWICRLIWQKYLFNVKMAGHCRPPANTFTTSQQAAGGPGLPCTQTAATSAIYTQRMLLRSLSGASTAAFAPLFPAPH